VLALGSICLLCLLRPSESILPLNYLLISEGMTAAEVEATLGGPENGPAWRQGLPVRFPNQGWHEGWQGSSGTIVVHYDVNGIVLGKEWHLRPPELPRFFERMIESPLENPFREIKVRELHGRIVLPHAARRSPVCGGCSSARISVLSTDSSSFMARAAVTPS